MNTHAISAHQIRAARALLDWSQDNLAQASNLSIATIRKLELGHISPRPSTTNVIYRAMENAGLEFIQSDGVRRRQEDIIVYQGADGLECLLEDMQHTVKNNTTDEIAIVAGPETTWLSANDREKYCNKLRQVTNVSGGLTIKCLLTDVSNMPPLPPCVEFRLISKHYIDPIPCYIYGDKHAFITPGAAFPKFIIIQSVPGSQAVRRQFYSIWDKATPFHMTSKPLDIAA